MSVQQIARRGLMGSGGGGGFGFVIGSYDGIDAITPNTITVRRLARFTNAAVPLTAIPNIHQGDTVTVTFEHIGGDEISGRFDYAFGGITVAAERTVSNWAGLGVSISANADASLAEFTITKENSGTYEPNNPPSVKITVTVNGTPIM